MIENPFYTFFLQAQKTQETKEEFYYNLQEFLSIYTQYLTTEEAFNLVKSLMTFEELKEYIK